MEVVEQENIGNQDERPLGYKVLRLITPELANRLGLPAESPVFVSPYLEKECNCGTCGRAFSPLSYQVGYVVEAQHFHGDHGGIYFHDSLNRALLGDFSERFIGIIEPLGQYGEYSVPAGWGDMTLASLSEGVYVRGIKVFNRADEELTEGVLVSRRGSLVPKSYDEARGKTRFTFRVDDGEIRFGMC